MKKCFLYLLMVGGLGACIQSEPLNAEADITACKILNAKGSPETNIKGNIIILIQLRAVTQKAESACLIPNDCSQCCHRCIIL
mgnify:CR=1 FL=1